MNGSFNSAYLLRSMDFLKTCTIVFAQMYQFSLNVNSLQQEFSLTSKYLGTNSVVVKTVDCI